MTSDEALKKFEKRKKNHFWSSIVLDALGMASYLVPVAGEAIDFVYAPIFGLAILAMYRVRKGASIVGGIGGVIEELTVGDFIPTALIMWVYTYKLNHDSTFNKFVKRLAKDQQLVEEHFGDGKKQLK